MPALVARGICWAALMWTRPDGCVAIAALGLAGLAFYPGSKKAYFGSLLKSAGICTILYLPWFVWAWSYYGSPIPHTVTAKSLYLGRDWASYTQKLSRDWLNRAYVRITAAYSPIYYGVFPGWPGWVGAVSFCLGLFSALYWLAPVNDRLGRMASLCFALLCLQHVFTAFFPWYLPPATICATVALVRGVMTLAAAASNYWRPALRVGVAALAMIAVELAVVFGLSTWQLKLQQELIEDGNRTRIGLWLKEHVKKGDGVYLEPIGYIGYFSEAKILDRPGLVTPRVVELVRKRGFNFYTLIAELRPEWMVLRPSEAQRMSAVSYFRVAYRPVKEFSVRPELEKYAYIPGRGYLEDDADYWIFKKVSETSRP